jgi:carboxylate-amine ligase
VEEEFVLLDSATGEVASVASEVVALLDGEPGIKHEAMRYQLEAVTGICTTLEQIRHELLRLRAIAAEATARLGCRLVASGVVPRCLPGLSALTDDPRYHELARRYTPLVAGCGTCGCHVHVGVPSRELGVQVLGRLRPWLASLLAASSNSPIADGQDTSWASWRYRRWSRWPSAMPPRVWRDAADYDAGVRHLIRRGAALDERGVYFHARLSARYPTVEVRVMDACLTVDDSVLIAALVRALVATALDEVTRDVPIQLVPGRRIIAALDSAAREGFHGTGIDPFSGRMVDQRCLMDRLANHILDSGTVPKLLSGLDERGTGAARQRAMWAQASTPQTFARLLAEATLTR